VHHQDSVHLSKRPEQRLSSSMWTVIIAGAALAALVALAQYDGA
jgi:hypothetical protein